MSGAGSGGDSKKAQKELGLNPSSWRGEEVMARDVGTPGYDSAGGPSASPLPMAAHMGIAPAHDSTLSSSVTGESWEGGDRKAGIVSPVNRAFAPPAGTGMAITSDAERSAAAAAAPGIVIPSEPASASVPLHLSTDLRHMSGGLAEADARRPTGSLSASGSSGR